MKAFIESQIIQLLHIMNNAVGVCPELIKNHYCVDMSSQIGTEDIIQHKLGRPILGYGNIEESDHGCPDAKFPYTDGDWYFVDHYTDKYDSRFMNSTDLYYYHCLHSPATFHPAVTLNQYNETQAHLDYFLLLGAYSI